MILDGKPYVIAINGKRFHCAMDITMHYIGGKWKTVILWYLKKEKKRFNELNKLIPEITEKMLSIQLKQLEESGLVQRKVFPQVPLRVGYSLTPFRKSLIPVLDVIAKWGRKTGRAKGKVLEIQQKF